MHPLGSSLERERAALRLLCTGREAEQEFGVKSPAELTQQQAQGDAPGRSDRNVHRDVVDRESLDQSDAESGRRNRVGHVDLQRMDAHDADEIQAPHAAEQDRKRDGGDDPADGDGRARDGVQTVSLGPDDCGSNGPVSQYEDPAQSRR